MNDMQASFALRGRNPDVLTCIANLSNDEVFTPPEFANRMLDTLAEAWASDHNGANLWADKTVKFLDPCTKSGVFLREITNRLTKGLVDEMPNLDERVDHILTRQAFGIGITHLTSLLARRSVYCSKHANGEHSVAKGFASDAGNIWFKRTEHKWEDGRCAYCGANQGTYDSWRSTWRRTRMRSSIPMTSRLGSPSFSEATCSSTSLSEIRHTNSAPTGAPVTCQSTSTLLSKRRNSNRNSSRWSFLRAGWLPVSVSASSDRQC